MGGLIPPAWTPEIAAHFAHRAGALCVAVCVAATAASAHRLRREFGGVRLPAVLLVVLVVVQILLGGSIIWTPRQVHVATTHVVVGAILLATSLVLTVRSRRLRAGARAALPVHRASTGIQADEVPA